MGIAENKKIVEAYFETFNSRGLPAAIDSLPVEATWWAAGQTRSKAEMAEAVGQISSIFSGPLTIETLNITAEEDRVAVEAKSNGDLANGKVYRNSYVFLFFVRDGKIAEIREHVDTARAARAFG